MMRLWPWRRRPAHALPDPGREAEQAAAEAAIAELLHRAARRGEAHLPDGLDAPDDPPHWTGPTCQQHVLTLGQAYRGGQW